MIIEEIESFAEVIPARQALIGLDLGTKNHRRGGV